MQRIDFTRTGGGPGYQTDGYQGFGDMVEARDVYALDVERSADGGVGIFPDVIRTLAQSALDGVERELRRGGHYVTGCRR